jgi:hypothetical protein
VSESFVDLTYRGLPLGRRIKLTQVRPSTGYLELPTPMPVGTTITIDGDGVTFDAIVAAIQEQVGGIDRAPGMTIKPKLDGAAVDWWKTRVALPDEAPKPRPRPKITTVRPRTQTQESPPPTITDRMPTVSEPPPIVIEDDNTKRTTVMNAADQELLEQLAKNPDDPVMRTTGQHAVVDDGKRTVIMESVEVEPDAAESVDDDDKPKSNGDSGVKRRKKRR